MFPFAQKSKAIGGNPPWSVRLSNLSWILFGKKERTAEYWLWHLKQNPQKPQLKAVRYLIKHQLFQEARNYLDEIKDKFPASRAEIDFLEALCLKHQGLIQEALHKLEILLQGEPENWEFLEIKADSLLELGDWQEAALCLNKAVRANPKNVELLFHLGNIYAYHGEQLEALSCFQGCCELKPHQARYWEMKGEAHLNLDQIAQAKACFSRALRYSLNSDLEARLAYCLIQLREEKKGIKHYRHVLKYEPDHYEALCNLAAVYQNLGRSEEALNLQERAYSINKSDPILLNNMAYSMTQLGRSRKASEYYLEALKLVQHHPLILYNLAVCYVQKGNWEEGIVTLKELLSTEAESLDGWALLGKIYDQTSQYEAAIDCYNKALKLS